ncbi:diguanylate cyclase [Chitinibacter bivalviorum]|uniref:Diguanylate cyclase n=1 Tax=Chitinibacter bivalviorum TaxID=2739434 RepID=A0A7H9BHS9_9NEIS|nr:diguanylate cyclase [Chitinibacter bivalviorum]QLG88099.1 diguanylate cyclase [Chitinibacter bivalviorum]
MEAETMEGLSAVTSQLIELEHKIHTGNANAAIEPLKKILNAHKHVHEISAQALYLLGWVQWAKNQYSDAEKTIRAALKLMSNEHPAYFPALLKKASIETSQNHFFKGLHTWLFILDHADSNQHPNIISEAYLGIGSYFKVKESAELAETCFQYAYDFSKQGQNHEAQVKCGIYLLSVYCSTNKYTEAQKTIDECWPILKLLNEADPVLFADMHHYSGMTLASQNNFEQAIESIHRAQRINEENQFLWGQTQNRIQLAKIYAKQNKYHVAITQLESAVLISSIFDHGVIQQEICGIIREIHKSNHNYAAALSAHEAYHHLAIKNRAFFNDDSKKKNGTRLKTLENRLEVIQKKQTESKLKSTIDYLEQKIISLTTDHSKDSLTGAPNQLYFLHNQNKPNSKKNSESINLLINIRNLFDINVIHGRHLGDEVICAVYQALTLHFKHEETSIIRYYGQQFLVLNATPSSITKIHQISLIIERLKTNKQAKIELAIHRIGIKYKKNHEPIITTIELLWQFPAGEKS